MKRIILTILIAAFICPCNAQTINDYNDAIHSFQYFYNHKQPDSIYALYSDKIKATLTQETSTANISRMYEQIGDLSTYEFIVRTESATTYKTTFHIGKYAMVVTLNKENKFDRLDFSKDADTVKAEKSNFFYYTDSNNIYGTLVTPPGMHKVPVVLIIPGSGPTDRNGNTPLGEKPNMYSMIADSLKKEGYASLRYDKRGVAESADIIKSEDSLRFDDMVNDAIGITKLLKKHWRFSKVIILGHSDGSLIGMRVAQLEKVDGFISVEGVAQRADKIIEKQLRSQSKKKAKQATVIADSIVAGYTVAVVDPIFAPIFRRSVQDYMRSWLKYTPKEEIKKLKVPVLIVQGTTDLQVNVKEAKLLKEAYPDATLTIIEGMNHVLKNAPKDKLKNMATYTNPLLPLSAGLMPAITKFIKEIK